MKTILFAISLIGAFSFAQEEGKEWAGNLEMNGYKSEDYKNFAIDYTLITVRYRQDSGEYRFTYANDIALKALKEGKGYPDGSVFAKTAYTLSPDTSFPSSLVPNKVARYQLMVKNANKHKDTDGWGYALFDKNGRTFPGDPKKESMACNACHQIVREKHNVFSELIQKDISFFSNPKADSVAKKKNKYLPEFETVSVSKLPKSLSVRLPKGTKTVRSLKGDLRKYFFEGTLNELRPFLGSEAIRAKMPAVLVTIDNRQFSVVYTDPTATADSCKSAIGQASSMVAFISMPKGGFTAPYADPGDPSGDVAISSFCFVGQ